MGPAGQALPCPCSHLDKGTACPRRPGPCQITHRESHECMWLQALGCLDLGQMGRELPSSQQTFSLLDSVGCTNLR